MARYRTHRLVGGLAGGVTAGVVARNQPAGWALAEIAGGTVGGIAGGILPDWLEPALGSYHRSFFHSIAAAAAAGSLTHNVLFRTAEGPIQQLRAKADELAERSCIEQDPMIALFLFLTACAARMLAGAISGFVAGYGSHLILDAATARSLPLVVQGL